MSSTGKSQDAAQLREASSRIAEHIEKSPMDLCVIITHYDADGLAAASIIARALTKLERSFIVRVIDQADEETLGSVPRGDYYIFTDLGSSAIDIVVRLGLKPASIIDHHEPNDVKEGVKDVQELNPHRAGIDGGREVSASGLAYLVSKSMGVEDSVAPYLAIAGAVGDRQENSAQGFMGINRIIVEEAVGKGLIKKTVGLRLYGVPKQPLVKSLVYTVDPVLPGLTYDEAACQRFLESTGIPLKKPDGSPTTYRDLSIEDISKLATNLVKHMLSKGLSAKVADMLFGHLYEYLLEPEPSPLRYAHEYAQVLNACGRLRRHGIGLALCLGDREKALSQAELISSEYRRRLAQYISLLRNDASYVRQLNNIQIMRLNGIVDDRIIGAIASIALSSYLCNPDKPLIAATTSSQGKVKISARMQEMLLKRGIDLGLAVKHAAELVGGSGGGHSTAAGALIPADSLDDFIKTVDSLIGKPAKQGSDPCSL
ncbi:MAG: DHH family phosphoesterase [Candidatus Nezhaarchaeota archaeon]|nr:DHH family phosphoesterase [Candidatus Nezhaarchaeota archaeon]